MNQIDQASTSQIEITTSVRIRKTNPKREEFERFLDNVRVLNQTDSDRCAFTDILQSLKTKSQTIYDISELTQAFEYLLRRSDSDKRSDSINWSEVETVYLVSVIAYYSLVFSEDHRLLSDKDWQFIEGIFPTKQVWQITKKWKQILNTDVRQFPWTAQEDALLTKLVAEYGTERNWKIIAEKLMISNHDGVERGMKQCRERWIKHLNPSVSKCGWSEKEDCKLMYAYILLGRKWSKIAKSLGDRTDTAVKSRWTKLINQEIKKENSLDDNFSYSDDISLKAIAISIMDRLRSYHKNNRNNDTSSIKPEVKMIKQMKSESKTEENRQNSQPFHVSSEKQNFDFYVNNLPQVKWNSQTINSGSGMLFNIVDMTNNRVSPIVLFPNANLLRFA